MLDPIAAATLALQRFLPSLSFPSIRPIAALPPAGTFFDSQHRVPYQAGIDVEMRSSPIRDAAAILDGAADLDAPYEHGRALDQATVLMYGKPCCAVNQ